MKAGPGIYAALIVIGLVLAVGLDILSVRDGEGKCTPDSPSGITDCEMLRMLAASGHALRPLSPDGAIVSARIAPTMAPEAEGRDYWRSIALPYIGAVQMMLIGASDPNVHVNAAYLGDIHRFVVAANSAANSRAGPHGWEDVDGYLILQTELLREDEELYPDFQRHCRIVAPFDGRGDLQTSCDSGYSEDGNSFTNNLTDEVRLLVWVAKNARTSYKNASQDLVTENRRITYETEEVFGQDLVRSP